MSLYEITTGFVGESYERMYVWAADEAAARRIAEPVLAKARREARGVEKLLDATDAEFATELTCDGWKR